MSIPQSVLDRTKSPDFENNVAWMYLDPNGNVTVGAGHMLASDADAAALAFVNNSDGAAASSEAKTQEWNSIHAQEANHVFTYYQQFTSLHLPQDQIERGVAR